MPVYLNTLGRSTLGIGICDRCKFKFPLEELGPDPNIPGLRVCKKDADQFDPWRLPALQDDRLVLPFVRPDEDIAVAAQAEEQVPLRILDDEIYYRDVGEAPADDDDYLRGVEE